VALQGLALVLSDDDLLQAFMAFTGADGSEMAAEAQNPAFLAAVMDFILQEDQRVITLAAACDLQPAEIASLRMALPGWGG
jgi:hypothetical protein